MLKERKRGNESEEKSKEENEKVPTGRRKAYTKEGRTDAVKQIQWSEKN